MAANNNADDNYIKGIFEFLKNNYGKSIELLSQSIEGDPCHKLAFQSPGSAYSKLKKFDETLADFGRAIKQNPSYPRPYYLLGLVQ